MALTVNGKTFHRVGSAILLFGAALAGLGASATRAQEQPSVTSSRPADSETNVLRDVFVAADVHVPNGGIDPFTLSAESVKLYRSSDGAPVPSVRNTSGGGDAIVLRPDESLDADTSYTFEVTSELKDVAGEGFVPFVLTFTTGSGVGGTDATAAFDRVPLPTATGKLFTCVAVGPDRKLYASALTGEIVRYPIQADGTLGAAESIDALRSANGGNRFLMGLELDPAATATDLIFWASHSAYGFTNGPDWTGKISRLSGPNLQSVVDYVVGLPRSTRDHVTNQLHFGPDGALYFPQGSNTAMGAPDSAWGNRPERLLSAAVLRLEVSAIVSPPLDVKTEAGGAYDPFAASAPLRIFASGVRNAYDLCWHSNGHLYVPTNGSASGGATPATPMPIPSGPRIDEDLHGPYTGPAVPGIANVTQTENDYLFDVVELGYYGHPNPRRVEWVQDGGNPTSGTDPAEFTQYPVGTLPDRNYRGFAFDFGQHLSPDGVVEYRSATFGGSLLGKLLVIRYSGGDDIIVLGPGSDGTIATSQTGIPGFRGFNDPLDLVEDLATGNLYVAEHGGQRIFLLRPNEAAALPTPPGSLTATALAGHRIHLSWTDHAASEAGFKVERSPDGVAFIQIATPAENAAAYDDLSLPAGATYFYRVRAHNPVGDSAYSNTASASLAAPLGITDLRLEKQSGLTVLSWTPLPAVDGYDVVRGSLAGLLASPGDFSLATEACLHDDLDETTLTEPTETQGEGSWYLVRGRNGAENGTYDDGSPAQAATRDPEIDAAAAACP